MKKTFITITLLLTTLIPAFSQNIQLHYDFGRHLYGKGEKSQIDRPAITSTIEMFRPDKYGSTFFFVDMNYGTLIDKNTGKSLDKGGCLGAYWEISRDFQFWNAPISAHIEYNGGLDTFIGNYNDAWLLGPKWSWANKDYTITCSLAALYKLIPRNKNNIHNIQLTGVWNIYFASKRFLFSGFADYWMENRPWQNTKFIFLTEPQLWYNLNTIKGLRNFNFSIGTELEISCNFISKGWYINPTLAIKYEF